MPRECITIQAGQCGNQVGCKFWESALREHAAAASGNRYPAFDDALSSFFRNVDTRYKPPREIKAGNGSVPIQCLKARAVLIDMEEGVVNQLLKGPLSELFDEKQYITDNSGSGNNWKKESWDAKAEAGQRLPTSRGGSKVRPGKPFDEMNGIAANLLLHLTSSMRFEGTLNVDLNEITTNLVPFPRLHFLVSSMAPFSSSSVCGSLEYGRFQDWFVQSASSRHAMFPPLSCQQHMHWEQVCNDEGELQQAVQKEILRSPLHSVHGHWGL